MHSTFRHVPLVVCVYRFHMIFKFPFWHLECYAHFFCEQTFHKSEQILEWCFYPLPLRQLLRFYALHSLARHCFRSICMNVIISLSFIEHSIATSCLFSPWLSIVFLVALWTLIRLLSFYSAVGLLLQTFPPCIHKTGWLLSPASSFAVSWSCSDLHWSFPTPLFFCRPPHMLPVSWIFLQDKCSNNNLKLCK